MGQMVKIKGINEGNLNPSSDLSSCLWEKFLGDFLLNSEIDCYSKNLPNIAAESMSIFSMLIENWSLVIAGVILEADKESLPVKKLLSHIETSLNLFCMWSQK